MNHTSLNCDNDCARMAQEDPKRLVGFMMTMSPTLLTFAAERLGDAPADVAVPTLLPLLRHERAYVREGAVLGLCRHVAHEGVAEALRAVADDEGEASEVRLLAAERLTETP